MFESIDLAPIPGFSGTPLNLLVALDANGQFLDVRVLSHHEPVFLDGLGEQPLFDFVGQYKGLSLRQSIKIGERSPGAVRAASTSVQIDGVSKATASVRIINQSVLAASLKVARAKLGYSGGVDPDRIAQVRADLYAPMDWPALVEAGLVQTLVLRERDVNAAFAGSAAEGVDAGDAPDDMFVTLHAALATVPGVGRNLLGEAGWQAMQARIQPGDQVLLLMSSGRYSFVGEEFVRGAVPDRLALRQGELPIELRDLDLDSKPAAAGAPPIEAWKAFRIIGQSGLDPGRPMELSLRVTRARGIVYPERVGRDFTLRLEVPPRYLIAPAQDEKGWARIWHDRAAELAVLVAALALLGWVLARQSPLVADHRRLRWFRPAFLVFTLVFIGWFAQGQLSIVNVVAVIQAAAARRDFSFLLYDPMSLVLWGFVLITLLVWGRGTFCGWLCPFGALQELVSMAARRLRVPQVRLRTATDRRLKLAKYVFLAAIVAAAVGSATLADRLVEIEPFKTAITLAFVRSWPFVAYAVALVALGAVVNKFFCRYVCPLGAGLALAGRLHGLRWIARRRECGTPCQTCRHRCQYQAIEPTGRIDYAECFQCMDCVTVYRSDELCVPLILERKRKRAIPIAVAGA